MKNKRSLSLILPGSAFLLFSFGQPALALFRFTASSDASAAQRKYAGVSTGLVFASSHPQDPIQTIRTQYATINKGVRKYKKVKRDLSGYSAEGGALVAYLDGPKIVKIVVNHYGESGKALEEYYYWDDRLIFVFRKDSGYDKPGSGKVVRTAESRYYFNNDRLIRWIDENAKEVAPDSGEYLEKEKEYLKISKEFTDGARSRKSVIESAP